MLFEPHTSNPANYRHIKRAGKKSSYSGILNGKKHIPSEKLRRHFSVRR